MKRSLFLTATILILLQACQPDVPKGWSELSLMEYGVPITLLAPDSSDVKSMDLGLMKDISVKKGDDYFVQITASEATTTDVASIKSGILADEQKRSGFSQVVQDDPNGFIFERQIDSTRNTYDFRYIQIKGGQEFIFQTGLSGFYTQEEVEKMYDSVKQE